MTGLKPPYRLMRCLRCYGCFIGVDSMARFLLVRGLMLQDWSAPAKKPQDPRLEAVRRHWAEFGETEWVCQCEDRSSFEPWSEDARGMPPLDLTNERGEPS